MAMPLMKAGQMHRIQNSPEFLIPVYIVYSREMRSRVLEKAIEGLR